jgi:hypothetical protein
LNGIITRGIRPTALLDAIPRAHIDTKITTLAPLTVDDDFIHKTSYSHFNSLKELYQKERRLFKISETSGDAARVKNFL